jgi:hypothetical protein
MVGYDAFYWKLYCNKEPLTICVKFHFVFRQEICCRFVKEATCVEVTAEGNKNLNAL